VPIPEPEPVLVKVETPKPKESPKRAPSAQKKIPPVNSK